MYLSIRLKFSHDFKDETPDIHIATVASSVLDDWLHDVRWDLPPLPRFLPIIGPVDLGPIVLRVPEVMRLNGKFPVHFNVQFRR